MIRDLTLFPRQLMRMATLWLLIATPVVHAAQNKTTWATLSLVHDSHLVSYGRDVWGAGRKLGGERANLFHPSLQLGTKWKTLSLYGGTWMDINRNSQNGLRGNIQEFDLWLGYGLDLGRLDLGMTLQRWTYASVKEVVLDSWLTFNDRGLLFDSLALNPGLTLHTQLAADLFDHKASVLVTRINPGHRLGQRKIRPLWLSLPVEIGFQQDGFRGNRGGHSFTSVGLQLYAPLVSLPKRWGLWSANLGMTWYDTDQQRIPTNPEARFSTLRLGLLRYF